MNSPQNGLLLFDQIAQWLNKNRACSKMVVLTPYYGDMLTMAFCKPYTIYYTKKWATIKPVQEMESILII